MKSAIKVTELRKTYLASKKSPAKEALKGINLEVPEGSIFGLLGPNGAGKSTLINIMAGLTIKTSGQVEICGFDIDTQVKQAKSSIGIVPQELIVDTFFTVREALEIHGGYYGIAKKDRRTQEIIDAVGLSEQADLNSRRLSGGMKRRLLVAKALVHSPKVPVLDEPTAGVDVELRTQLWNYVRKLNKAGTTVLLTTHYLEEAQELCDEIAIINHGQVVTKGSKSSLMSTMDNKVITIHLQQPVAELPASLQSLGARLEKHDIVLEYRSNTDTLQQLLTEISNLGLKIGEIKTSEAKLEDVFRHFVTAVKIA